MNRSNVEEIKARIPIEELIGSYVKLDKAGKSYKAKCPFHNEKSASFFVSPDRGGYYCFGCNAKGDIFTFVEQFEGLDFRGALKILAERAGVKLVYDQKADSEKDRLYSLMEVATKYFEDQLNNSKEAKDYVKNRGIDEKTVKNFRIGWAPEGWRNLQTYLKGKGYSDVQMEKAGLIKKSEENMPQQRLSERAKASEKEARTQQRPTPFVGEASSPNFVPNFYDRFRGRIMFPITDSSGRVVAFSGRILKDDDKSAKYLNSPDTPLYDKSLVLYGLDKAKSEIRRLNYSIFVEGQMDLVLSHQAGITNTVAASGTALTDETMSTSGVVSNLGLVRRLSPNVIIAFDSDSAGRKAAMRAANIALSLNMDVKIADIVGGKDPADLVKDDVNIWKNVLRSAKQVIEFELDNVLREASEPRKVSKAIIERVLPLVSRIESSSDKSHFVTMIASRASLSPDIIWQDLKVVTDRIKATDIQNSKPETLNPTPSLASDRAKQIPNSKSETRTSNELPSRIDLIERRLFGLIALMEREKSPKLEVYRQELKKIADISYESRVVRAQNMMSDLMFEAEAFFGNDMKNWDKHMDELLVNFEEDLINEELMVAMQNLKAAERAKDIKLLEEYAKKCQVLSTRKAEIGKRRK